MDFFHGGCKGSTSKYNSANSWGTQQTQVQKPRMIKALRSEAQHWKEEPGIKYEMCIERKPVEKKAVSLQIVTKVSLLQTEVKEFYKLLFMILKKFLECL